MGHVTRRHLCGAGHGRVHAEPQGGSTEPRSERPGVGRGGARPSAWGPRASCRRLLEPVGLLVGPVAGGGVWRPDRSVC